MCRGFTIKDGDVFIEEFDVAKTLGFDYFEIGYQTIEKFTEEEFQKALKYIKDNQITVLSANLFAPPQFRLTGEEKDEQKIIDYCHKTGARAKQMGIRKVVMGSGGARNRPNGYSVDKANADIEASVKLIAKILTQYGITLILEHLNKQDTNLLTLFSETAALSRKCDNVKGILDTFHFEVGNEDKSIIKQNQDTIGHVHFARLLGRVMPQFVDICEIEPMMKIIKAIDYDDLLSFECKFENLADNKESYAKVVRYFKQYFNA